MCGFCTRLRCAERWKGRVKALMPPAGLLDIRVGVVGHPAFLSQRVGT